MLDMAPVNRAPASPQNRFWIYGLRSHPQSGQMSGGTFNRECTLSNPLSALSTWNMRCSYINQGHDTPVLEIPAALSTWL